MPAMNPHVVQLAELRFDGMLTHQHYVDTAAAAGVDLYSTDAPFEPAVTAASLRTDLEYVEYKIAQCRRLMTTLGYKMEAQLALYEQQLPLIQRALARELARVGA